METIFDCKFKPESPDLLATASFDGTIKVWDVNTMNAVSIFSVGERWLWLILCIFAAVKRKIP